MPAVVVKKEEKVRLVFDVLGESITEERFIDTFKQMYPKEWDNIQRVYANEERNTEPGKTHPMPHPDIYLKNMYNTAVKKYNEHAL